MEAHAKTAEESTCDETKALCEKGEVKQGDEKQVKKRSKRTKVEGNADQDSDRVAI